MISLDRVRTWTTIQEVKLVADYGRDPLTGRMVLEDTLQPVFVVMDSYGQQHLMSLKHLEEFSVADQHR